jgi:hypothetical protein
VIACCLVVAAAIPAILPFLLIADPSRALRISNALLVVLLLLMGLRWAALAGTQPWRMRPAPSRVVDCSWRG